MDEKDEAQDAKPWGAFNDVGFVLRLAQVAVFKDLIQALAPHDLRPAHYAALSLVHGRPGLEQHQLGQLLSMRKSNLVVLVDELCRRGLMTRQRQGRSYALALSPQGAVAHADMERAALAHERRVQASIGDEAEREALVAALRRLASGLG